MKKKHTGFLLLLAGLLFSEMVFAQELWATDTSPQSVKRYQNIIRNNRKLVSFIEYTFKSRGISKHMRNLAIIESGLDHQAVSHAGAKGMWQFMADHANQYGLSEEERSDMYKSTKTAAVSLINLYNKYGNWITVVAAYNCGEGNIKKAMDKAGSRQYTAFAGFLPLETQNHVKKYLNACYATGELNQVLSNYYKIPQAPKTTVVAVTNPEKAAERSPKNAAVKKAVPLKKGFLETAVNAAYDLEVVAKFLKITKMDILRWNPAIEKTLAEKGQSSFYLPEDKMLEFNMNKNKILSESLKN